jgi:hypothetical protein
MLLDFDKLQKVINILICLMLIGLCWHGVEIFIDVEGGGFWAFIKAVGTPIGIECASAVSMFVAFSYKTKGWATRGLAFVIAGFCVAASIIIQYDYYKGKLDFDLWYSVVLPCLVAALSALSGLLDLDEAAEARKELVPADVPPPAPQIDFVALMRETSEALTRQLEERFDNLNKNMSDAIAGLPSLVTSEVYVATANMRAELQAQANEQAQAVQEQLAQVEERAQALTQAQNSRLLQQPVQMGWQAQNAQPVQDSQVRTRNVQAEQGSTQAELIEATPDNIAALREQGKSWGEIETLTGVNVSTLRSRLNRSGTVKSNV